MTEPFVPEPELRARLDGLRRRLEASGLEGALLHGVSTLLYFAGSAQQGHLWVPVKGPEVYLVRRVLERARRESALPRVEGMRSFRGLAERLGGARRIGMELDIMPVSLFQRYEAALDGLSAVDVGPATRELRAVKSPLEISRIRASARLHDAVCRAVRGALRPGVSELELGIVAESTARRHGYQGMLRWRASTGFECPWSHILVGESALAASFPDTPFGGEGLSPAAPYGPGRRTVEAGMPVCIDLALPVDGYIHDATRTLVVGELPPDLARAHDVAVRILERLETEVRPGITAEGVWDRSVELVEEAGLGAHFMGWGEERARFVGHGVGLELDELPVLAPRQSTTLVAGHVLAIEPKFFFPGLGAVGVENTYVLRSSGLENLTITPSVVLAVAG